MKRFVSAAVAVLTAAMSLGGAVPVRPAAAAEVSFTHNEWT